MKISPLLTDLYQFTMMQGYFDQNMLKPAVFEFFVRRLPGPRNFLIAAGLQQVVEYLESLAFTSEDIAYLRSTGFFHDKFLDYLQELTFTGSVHAMEEGTVFFGGEPVLRVTASLPVAQLVETRIINILMFQTMIASKAARMRLVAPDKALVDFGLRRAHGAEAGLLAARASYIAGLDGTATVDAGRAFGIPLFGTMAHSFIQAHDNEVDAFRHFAASQENNVLLLIDTFDIEQGARKVVELAPELATRNIVIKGVRIDSGDLAEGAKSVRHILDAGGLTETKIFLTSNLDEYAIQKLRDADVPVDGYGVGTKMITSSDFPYLDCSYKLVEYGGKGKRKLSQAKQNWPGRKQVFRSFDEQGMITRDVLGLEDEQLPGTPLLKPVIQQGQRVYPLPDIKEIKKNLHRQLQALPSELRDITTPAHLEVAVSEELAAYTREVDAGRA